MTAADFSARVGDDYPYANRPFCTNSSCVDPWNFYYRQCTSFVAWRMNQLGIDFANRMGGGHFGNAEHWDDNAESLGYAVDSSPTENAIAVWEARRGMPNGHVAVVQYVNGDGTIAIEEYNLHNDGKYGTRTIQASSPDHFIHMQ
ncbi:CHAP domain-containing protein [Sorangium sp. So ce1000]|uniref:CHAP domain-containing protein n=1 Tax=Sorangium sp. So ce1000 TaxID=3133325 RepID=UPI003F636489